MVQSNHMEIRQKEIIVTFFTKYTRIAYKKGEIILRAQDDPAGLMYLEKGYVRQYFVGEEGAIFLVHIFKPGSMFPMSWMVNDTPNTYYFDALTPVVIWRAPKAEAREFLHAHPDIMVDFASRLLTGVTGFLERMQYVVLKDAYDKLILLLLYYVKNFSKKTERGYELLMPLTHKEIAAWIGTTRETASVQVETLKAKGLIMYKGRQMIIPDPTKLKRELAS